MGHLIKILSPIQFEKGKHYLIEMKRNNGITSKIMEDFAARMKKEKVHITIAFTTGKGQTIFASDGTFVSDEQLTAKIRNVILDVDNEAVKLHKAM